MSIYINTDTNSLYSQYLLSLYSGILLGPSPNSSADAALSTTEQQNSYAYQQYGNNATQGVSLTQTASSGLEEITNLLQQMGVLASEGASGLLSSSELGNLQTEYGQLASEVNNIAGSTQFNGISLLQNQNGSVSIQVSPTDNITVQLPQTNTTTLGIASTDVSTAADAANASTAITNAINSVSSNMAQLGASQVTLENASVQDANLATEMTTASTSLAGSPYYAMISTQNAINSALVQADIAMLAQANSNSKSVLQLLSP